MSDAPSSVEDEALRIRSAALEAMSLGVVIVDADGLIGQANDAVLALTGYPRSEVIGSNFSFLRGNSSSAATLAEIEHALSTRADFRGPMLSYRKDGSTFWIELSVSPMRGERGAVTHFVGSMQDVSPRVVADRALRQSEERLQLALLGGSLGLWDWQWTSGALTVNARWMEQLGLDPDGPSPTIDTWGSRVHPDDAVKLERIIDDVILNPAGTNFEAEVRARHAGGRWVWILDRGAVVERAADGPFGADCRDTPGHFRSSRRRCGLA